MRGEAPFTVGLQHTGWYCLMPLILSGECVDMRAAVCVHQGKKPIVSDTVIIVNVNMKGQISLSGARGIRSLQPAQDLVIKCFYYKYCSMF